LGNKETDTTASETVYGAIKLATAAQEAADSKLTSASGDLYHTFGGKDVADGANTVENAQWSSFNIGKKSGHGILTLHRDTSGNNYINFVPAKTP
jgi:hypothetical protein